ncbi:MAG: MarR family transcriptional regulator [Veillonellaceae bacterium]|nr:MarR family transcriptional regulator [Veillonellaceae bacterium]
MVLDNSVAQAAILRELLRTLIRKLGILERSEALCCDMTLSQCNALIEVGRAGVLSVNQLADRLNLDKSTTSRVSDKLVLDGQLLRQEDPNDRRYVVLKLTERGNQIYTNLESRMTAYFEEVMDAVDPTERAAMLRGLQALASALNSNSCC